MEYWFIWKDENSSANGLWISKMPDITRAEERTEKIKIPGRAGTLICTEGDDVYDSYLKECVIICRRDMNLQRKVAQWLRGDGEVVFSNEIAMKYKARISGTIQFEKVSNDLVQAVIPFFVEPFKELRNPESYSLTGSGTIYNPGDVVSKPKVTITASGTASVTIAGETMTFNSVDGSIVVDCDAEFVTQNGELWDGSFSGNFWRIPKGQVAVAISGATNVVIEPNWRWV